MCYSAEASLITGGALLCCGALAAVHLARPLGRRAMPLAVYPAFFGAQQIAEGFLWISLEDPARGPAVPAAMVFLLFAYWVWPVWVPLSAAAIEPDDQRRRLFFAASLAGGGLGASLYLPVLTRPDLLNIEVVQRSIHYGNATLVSGETAEIVTRVVYGALIVLPLMASSHRLLRSFGYLLLASLLLGLAFASYAFTSIWCFIAAWLSIYILVALRAIAAEPEPAHQMQRRTGPP